MSDFSIIGNSAEALESGYDYTATKGATVTSSGTVDTKGAWVELLSAANNIAPSDEICVYITAPGLSGDARLLIDLGVGAAGSEEIIIPNMYSHLSASSNGVVCNVYYVPIKIPSGVRIAARCQSSNTSSLIQVHIVRQKAAFISSSGLGEAVAFGANTASTKGVTVARSTVNTFGSWVEIDASTSDAVKGIVIAAIRDAGSWSVIAQIAYQVAIGSAGNEEIINSGGMTIQQTHEGEVGAVSPFFPVGIPATTRIAIRAQSDIANTDSDLDFIVYGVK